MQVEGVEAFDVTAITRLNRSRRRGSANAVCSCVDIDSRRRRECVQGTIVRSRNAERLQLRNTRPHLTDKFREAFRGMTSRPFEASCQLVPESFRLNRRPEHRQFREWSCWPTITAAAGNKQKHQEAKFRLEGARMTEQTSTNVRSPRIFRSSPLTGGKGKTGPYPFVSHTFRNIWRSGLLIGSSRRQIFW